MCSRALPSRFEMGRRHSPFPKPPSGLELLAYFSIDAALALVIVVVAYSSFAHLASSAAAHAGAQSQETSSSLLALRFSSFALEWAAAGGGEGPGSFYSANELDRDKLNELDLGAVLSQTGKRHAKITVVGSKGGVLFEKEAGNPQEEEFCSGRLALLSEDMVRLEACLS